MLTHIKIFCCSVLCLPDFCLLPRFVAFQEYTEEFREIAPRSKKNLGGVADGNITLINQRSVCDDLPVRTSTSRRLEEQGNSRLDLCECLDLFCFFFLLYV